MFRYTASKQVLHTLRAIRRAPYVQDKEYHFIRSVLPTDHSYTTHAAFSRYFDGFVFCSPTKLNEVPLRGYLLPVSLFDCEEIK